MPSTISNNLVLMEDPSESDLTGVWLVMLLSVSLDLLQKIYMNRKLSTSANWESMRNFFAMENWFFAKTARTFSSAKPTIKSLMCSRTDVN